jgi:LCCL domain
VALALSCLVSVVIWAAPAPPSGAQIDWRTSPLDLNLRGLNGERFRFLCPPGKAAPGQPIGSGPYTDGSSICAAAAHAGVLHPSVGGNVLIEIRAGQAHFAGSLSHYIQSAAYEAYWDGSFVVVLDAPDTEVPANPGTAKRGDAR